MQDWIIFFESNDKKKGWKYVTFYSYSIPFPRKQKMFEKLSSSGEFKDGYLWVMKTMKGVQV